MPQTNGIGSVTPSGHVITAEDIAPKPQLQIPGGLFSLDTNGQTLAFRQNGQTYSFDPASLLTPEEKKGYSNYGQMLEAGKTKLKNQYGIDAMSLPFAGTTGDYNQKYGVKVLGYGGNLSEFLKQVLPTGSTQDGSQMVTVTSPTGETRQVRADQAPGFQNSGWSVSQLPASANKVLDVAEQQLANTPNKNDISASQFADWAAIFHANNDPYFQQLNAQSQQDLKTGLGQISQDLATGERKIGTDYATNLATTQANAASRGLTNSSIRNTQEKTLAKTTQAAIEAGRQQAERNALTLGTNAERKLGSGNLGDLSSYNVQNAPTPVLGVPGMGTLAPGAGTRSLFTPTGGMIGTNQRDQASLQENYVNTQAANYRSLNPMG